MEATRHASASREAPWHASATARRRHATVFKALFPKLIIHFAFVSIVQDIVSFRYFLELLRCCCLVAFGSVLQTVVQVALPVLQLLYLVDFTEHAMMVGTLHAQTAAMLAAQMKTQVWVCRQLACLVAVLIPAKGSPMRVQGAYRVPFHCQLSVSCIPSSPSASHMETCTLCSHCAHLRNSSGAATGN